MIKKNSQIKKINRTESKNPFGETHQQIQKHEMVDARKERRDRERNHGIGNDEARIRGYEDKSGHRQQQELSFRQETGPRLHNLVVQQSSSWIDQEIKS